jgi:hypothetical protein
MNTATRTVLLGLAVTLAACSDNSMVSPKASAPASTVRPISGGGSSAALTSWDTTRFYITIDPSQQTVYNLGAGNTIVFPAGSLCDPTSSYGVAEWDQPCAVATAAITINVMAWLDGAGKPRVDFSQHVRFVPTSNPAAKVNLTFADLEASVNSMFGIYYCPVVGQACIDESKTDPTLITIQNPATGQITRRLKHFSGYVVSADDCSDPNNQCIGSTNSRTPGFRLAMLPSMFRGVRSNRIAARREDMSGNTLLRMLAAVRQYSGYMLASG